MPSEIPIDAPSDGDVRPTPVAARPAGGRDVREQRRRRVEAERLGDRVAGDVHDDAGHRERRREREPEGEHAHVLQARVREQALPGERAPQERDGDRERDEPEADEDSLRHLLADGGRERLSERHATTSTAGRSALESSAETGGGASECASGSQLCTGAQPIFAARPARRSTNADGQLVRSRVERGQRAPREPAEPALHVRRDEHDPEQREPEPERRQHEVLPPGLERRGSPAEPDEERRGSRRGLDQEPGDAEVPGEWHRDEHRPEGEERPVVEARPAFRADELGARRRRGTRVT